jgi:multiple sugar transport system permease protein
MQTLPLGLSKLLAQQYARYDIAMPVASFATIPIIIFYLFFQKYLNEGITLTGLKE